MSAKPPASVRDPVTGAVPVSRETASLLLLGIIKDCKDQRLLFDLDSTLMDNRPRSAVIMREYARARNLPALLQAAPEHFPTWSARDSMVLMGVPAADADAMLDDYLDFWAVRFFSSEYCRYDTDIAGAVRFVNAIHSGGGVVIYLTGRDESMRDGTEASLQALGFPGLDKSDNRLIMKPSANESDDLYKKAELHKLSAHGGIAAAFDNEPTHINSYREIFPGAVCVHLNTDHSMRNVQLLDGIVSITNFEY